MARGLTPKQQRFVEEYLKAPNATDAARRAGYSARTANEQASRLLANVSVSAAIKKAQEARAARVSVTQDEVLEGIVRCIKASEEAEDNRTALKGYELLGKHLGMFVDKVKQETSGEYVFRWKSS